MADVQAWLGNPNENFGWIAIGDESFSESAKRFDSAQFEDAANRPTLTIEFDIPSELVGDFDANGTLDVGDIDLLTAAARAGSEDLTFDLNGDLVVNQADREFWINDVRGTFFGDSNLDSEFATSDFVLVFQAGQYEDTVSNNSTWATGDWNGDGEFDTADFVLAFQAGGFEIGPRAAQAIPEPTSCGWVAFAGIVFFTVRGRQLS